MSTENTAQITPYASNVVPGGEVRSIDWLVLDPDEETPWFVCHASLKVFVSVKKFSMFTDGRRLFVGHDALPLKAQTTANCLELAPLLKAGIPMKAVDADRRRYPRWHLNNVEKVEGGHMLDLHVELQWEV